MPVRTVRNFIERSLRIISAINVGEVPDADEANDALDLFNDMLDNWATKRLLLPYTVSAEYATVPGKKTYTVGPGGDWNGARPQKLRDAFLRIGGTLDIPMTQLEVAQYQSIPTKGTLSPQPTNYYYEAQFPLGIVSLYPVPNVVVGVVIIYDGILQRVTLDTDLATLPPGYALAIQYNLAILLAPEYNRPVSNDIARRALEYLGDIKSQNSVSMDAVPDYRLPGLQHRGWDYRIG